MNAPWMVNKRNGSSQARDAFAAFVCDDATVDDGDPVRGEHLDEGDPRLVLTGAGDDAVGDGEDLGLDAGGVVISHAPRVVPAPPERRARADSGRVACSRMDAAPPGPPTDTVPDGVLAVLRDRYVRRYLLAQTASTVGVALQTAILFKQLYDLTGSDPVDELLGQAADDWHGFSLAMKRWEFEMEGGNLGALEHKFLAFHRVLR